MVGKSSVMPAGPKPGPWASGAGAKARSRTTRGSRVRGVIPYTRLVLSKMKPARWALAYSRRFTVPPRLCSTSCRELVRPSTPASTLGFAAASITQSAAGSVSRSLAARRSPWKSFTPRRRRASRLASLPGRMKLSNPQMVWPAPRSAKVRASVLPTKPQMPEMRMRTARVRRKTGPR